MINHSKKTELFTSFWPPRFLSVTQSIWNFYETTITMGFFLRLVKIWWVVNSYGRSERRSIFNTYSTLPPKLFRERVGVRARCFLLGKWYILGGMTWIAPEKKTIQQVICRRLFLCFNSSQTFRKANDFYIYSYYCCGC